MKGIGEENRSLLEWKEAGMPLLTGKGGAHLQCPKPEGVFQWGEEILFQVLHVVRTRKRGLLERELTGKSCDSCLT